MEFARNLGYGLWNMECSVQLAASFWSHGSCQEREAVNSIHPDLWVLSVLSYFLLLAWLLAFCSPAVSFSPFVCLFVCLFVCFFVFLFCFRCLFVVFSLFVCLIVCLIVCLFVCLFVSLFVCLFVCSFDRFFFFFGSMLAWLDIWLFDWFCACLGLVVLKIQNVGELTGNFDMRWNANSKKTKIMFSKPIFFRCLQPCQTTGWWHSRWQSQKKCDLYCKPPSNLLATSRIPRTHPCQGQTQ